MFCLKQNPGVVRDVKSWAQQRGYLCDEQALSISNTIKRSLPECLDEDKDMLPYFEENSVFNTHERFVAKIPQARIIGDRGFIVLPDGQFAWEYITGHEPFITEHPLYQKRLLLRKRLKKVHLYGDYCSVHGTFARTFYHWMHDVLLQFYRLLERMPPSVKFILPAPLAPWQHETLAALGVSVERVVEHTEQDDFILENLWFVPPVAYTSFDEPQSLEWLSSRLKDGFSIPMYEKKQGRRIFVSRQDASYRKVTNEAEIASIAERAGFQVVLLERMSIREQLLLFSEAESIVAPHGAGLVHQFMMRRGGRVLELFPRGKLRRHYWSMAYACGHQYYALLGEALNKDELETDYHIKPEKFECMLTQFLS